MLTVERLRELLYYDPETGAFIRRIAIGRFKVGDTTGSTDPADGRRRILIDRFSYLASRLAWLYVTGVWPEHEVDHEDRDPGNDRWLNLRPATSKQNKENRSKQRNARHTQHVGVFWDLTRRKWRAGIGHNCKMISLGRFETEAEAVAARKRAEQKFFTHAGRA